MICPFSPQSFVTRPSQTRLSSSKIASSRAFSRLSLSGFC
nr:MAG TPA_asm: hypothetical protein [Caudoviricetes sp.]